VDAPARLRVDPAARDGRYDRQELISWWDQERLQNAQVLVVGAGALGNELVKNLTLLGVGTIVVADLDVVENSNLSRCAFFREEDEGRPKADVVAEGARVLNPDVTIVPVVGDVRLTLGLSAFRDADVVLGGLDNREARLHVNQACWKTGTPFVDGAIEGLMGVARTFLPPDSACYECTLNEVDRRLLAARRACSLLTREQMLAGHVPTTATTSSVIAGIQAQEAVKLLHRDVLDYEFGGRGFAYNGLTHDSYVVTYPRNELCLSHDRYELDGAAELPADATFGSALSRARAELDPAATLELELELVVAMTCPACGRSDAVGRPLDALSVGAADCPACGAERTLDLSHRVDDPAAPLAALTFAEAGVAAGDVVTATHGERRIHFFVPGSTRA
jgi:adenylyltransferase/sulfurtransferase